MRVLVTGAAGRLGRLLAAKLASQGEQVVGLDSRAWNDAPPGVEMIEADLLKRSAEDVFRTRRPEVVVHLATLSHLEPSREKRLRLNLTGTRNVIEFSRRYGAGSMIFVGRHTFYGATADSALYHAEDDLPLGLEAYPELGDIVAADLYAGSALWRYPELQTAVLRLCFTLGPAAAGTLGTLLGPARVPTVMGFDPLVQVMHEADAVSAIVHALAVPLRGVFNVAGPRPVPLSTLVRDTGRLAVPVPEPLFRLALARFGLPRLPDGVASFLKYPVVVDGSAFARRTGFQHEHDEQCTMHDYSAAVPVGLG